MALYFNNTNVTSIYYNGTQLTALYCNNTKVWPTEIYVNLNNGNLYSDGSNTGQSFDNGMIHWVYPYSSVSSNAIRVHYATYDTYNLTGMNAIWINVTPFFYDRWTDTSGNAYLTIRYGPSNHSSWTEFWSKHNTSSNKELNNSRFQHEDGSYSYYADISAINGQYCLYFSFPFARGLNANTEREAWIRSIRITVS